MTMIRNQLLALWLTLMMSSCVLATGTSTAAGHDLAERLKPLQAISGKFSQVMKDSEGEVLSESEGSFQVQRPGMLRWETVEPFPQLLVTNGKTLWMFDPDLEQVTISTLTNQLDQTPAVIFSGDPARIEARFEVSYNKSGGFSLRPRQTGSQFQQLDLFFEEQTLVSMWILDGFGQETEFSFTAMQTDRMHSPAYFTFDPPEGIDVLIQ